MGCRRLVVEDRKLPPVMRDVAESCRDRSVTRCLDFLTVCLELIHRVVCAGHCHACCLKNLGVYKHCLPETVCRHCIFFIVHQGRCDQVFVHVGRVVGILFADLVDGNYLARLDEAVGVCAVKEEQYIRLRACLKVCSDSCLKGLVCGCGSVNYCIACLCFPGLYRVLIVLCVGILTCEGGGYNQLYRSSRLCRRRFRLCCRSLCWRIPFCAGRFFSPAAVSACCHG